MGARRRPATPAVHGEDGFTLIEVLLVAVILPIVIAGVSMAIITSLRDDTGVSTRLSDSHDAQLTSAYFVRDVQSAARIYTGTTAICGSGAAVLGLEWNLTVGTPTYVSYVTKTVGSSPALVRNLCRGTTTTASTVSHGLAGTTSASVSLTCIATDSTCSSQAASGPIASGNVETVKVQITESSGYSYTLDASPRLDASAGASASPPTSSPPTLLLLGTSGADLSCSGSGNGPIVVNGVAASDSSSSPSVSLGSNITATAGQVYSGASSGAVSGTYTSTSTVPYQSGPPIPDPYASLPDPDPVALGLPTYAGPFDQNHQLPGPGVYTSAVNVTWNQTLSSGIYIFEGGFTAGGSPGTTITGTSGVLFFIGIPNALPGTPNTAGFSIAGNNTLNLAPMSSGPWAGLVIFQSRTDSTTLSTSGNGFSAGGGVIYAPDATVNTSGNGATAAGGIISQSLVCGGNGGVTLGSQVTTTTTLGATPSSPTSGQSITFTATVTAADALTPAGTVTFTETPSGSSTPVTMCSAKPVQTNGTATCTYTLTSAGSPYSVVATYGGNTTFKSSSNTPAMTETVLTPTSTSVAAAPPSPTTGQSVVLSAAVTPTPDGGAVTWSISDRSGTSVPCSTTTALAAGTATCTVASGVLAAGSSTYSVTASYSGDSKFAASSGGLTLTVGQATSSTSGAPSATSVAVGSPVTDTATVSGSGVPPSGQVQFYVCTSSTTGCDARSGTLFDTEPVSNGQATSTQYTPQAAGTYCFAAVYGGDADYTGSSDTATDQCFTAS